MNKILIPALLVATVMVAGMFAFAPVEQASTVHQTSGISAVLEHVTDSITADDDIRITCPTTTSGCHILEIYITETDGTGVGVRFDDISANIGGDAIATLIDNADLIVDGNGASVTALLPEAGGIALGPGDFIELNTNNANTDNAAAYSARIISVNGNGIALTSALNDE